MADENRLASQPTRCWNNLSFILSKRFEPPSVRLLTLRPGEGDGELSPSTRVFAVVARAADQLHGIQSVTGLYTADFPVECRPILTFLKET